MGWFLFFGILVLFKQHFVQPKGRIIDIQTGSNDSNVLLNKYFLFEPSDYPDSIFYYPSTSVLELWKTSVEKKTKKISNRNILQNKGIITLYFKKKISNEKFLPAYSFKELCISAQIYLDYKKVKEIGYFSENKDSIQYSFQSRQKYYLIIEDTSFHRLDIVYSIYSRDHFWSNSAEHFITLHNITNENIHSSKEIYNLVTLILNFFGTVPLVLSFLHFMMFVFYRKKLSNLYNFFGLLLFAVSFYGIALLNFDLGTLNIDFLPYLLLLSAPGSFIFFTLTYYDLFKPKAFKFLTKFLLAIYFIYSIMIFLSNSPLTLLFIPVIVLLFCYESFRIFFKALKDKPDGYLILITGNLIFVLILLYLFVYGFISIRFSFSGIFSLVIIILTVLSIPISMSVFMAYSFGKLNVKLENKLKEVEFLSSENIRKEKEKQEILLNQNIMLEKQVEERTREIQKQKKIIEEKNKDILDSINYATRIQGSIIPPEEEISRITGYGYVIYHPKDILSGDFYAVHQTPEGTFIIGADCTGHGVPGALMSMAGSTLIQKIINEYKIYSPGLILEKLNEELRVFLRQDRAESESKDGMDVAIVQIFNDKLIYAGANRPLWYLDKINNLNEIRPVKTSIGGNHVQKVNAVNHELSIRDVSKIFLFSDGCTDQFGGTFVKKITSKRLKEWILQSADFRAKDMKSFLMNKITEWKGTQEQTDDILFLCIGFT